MDKKLKYLIIGGCIVTVILIVVFITLSSDKDVSSSSDEKPVYINQGIIDDLEEETIDTKDVNMLSTTLQNNYVTLTHITNDIQDINDNSENTTEHYNFVSDVGCNANSLKIVDYMQNMFNSDNYYDFVKNKLRNDSYYDNLSDNMTTLIKLLINSETNIIKNIVNITKTYKNILSENKKSGRTSILEKINKISNKIIKSNNLLINLEKYNFEHIFNIQQIINKWFQSLDIDLNGICITTEMADELNNNIITLFTNMSKLILIVQKICNVNNTYIDLSVIVNGKIGFGLYITYNSYIFDEINYIYPIYVINSTLPNYSDPIDLCLENNIQNDVSKLDDFTMVSNCTNINDNDQPLYLTLKNPPNPEYKSVDSATDLDGININTLSSRNISLCPDKFGLCNNSRQLCNDVVGICADASGACPDLNGICPDGSYVNTCPDASGVCINGSDVCVDVNNICSDASGVCPDASGVCPDGTYLDASGLDASGLDASGLDASGKYYEDDNYLPY